MAAQKVRVKTDPLPEENKAPKLTAEQRREMYAPKSALAIIPKRPPMPVRAVKTTAKATAWGLGLGTWDDRGNIWRDTTWRIKAGL
jgi:hypothetical protein